MSDGSMPLDRLVTAVLASAKYRHVCADLIRGIGARELAKGRSLKESIKATKNALHQAGGAYQPRPIDYAAALADLRAARDTGDPARWRAACAQVMSQHASTHERLPILDRFYPVLLADLGPIRSVLDLACGLNPLALPWMPLAVDAEYYACDIYGDMVGFLNEFLALAGRSGHAEAVDLTRGCPSRPVDVALLLKGLPCLEQLEPGIGSRLLATIPARCLLVSFPARSLGGRNKGMARNYDARFRTLIAEQDWSVERFDFVTEVVYRLTRPGVPVAA